MLVFFAAGVSFAAIQYSGANVLQQPGQVSAFGGAAFLIVLISGFATYLLLRRKHEARLKELSSLISQMKKKLEEEQHQKKLNEGGETIAEDGLSLADKILTLLPEIAPRKRNLDSLLFGVIGFIVAALVGRNLAAAIVVGSMVWLYFRYETGKSYEREISKFEEQKRVYEQRKKDIIESL